MGRKVLLSANEAVWAACKAGCLWRGYRNASTEILEQVAKFKDSIYCGGRE